LRQPEAIDILQFMVDYVQQQSASKQVIENMSALLSIVGIWFFRVFQMRVSGSN
jgi:hypothetical protein